MASLEKPGEHRDEMTKAATESIVKRSEGCARGPIDSVEEISSRRHAFVLEFGPRSSPDWYRTFLYQSCSNPEEARVAEKAEKTGVSTDKSSDSLDRRVSVAPMMDWSYTR